MKKKSKKGVIPKQKAPAKPPKVGGGRPVSTTLNWSKVGRRRLEDNVAIVDLAASFKSIREEQGISVTQLAKDLGVAPATLIKFEDRSYPISIKVVLGMADKLGCTLEVKPAKGKKKK